MKQEQKEILLKHLQKTMLMINDLGYTVYLTEICKSTDDKIWFNVEDLKLEFDNGD